MSDKSKEHIEDDTKFYDEDEDVVYKVLYRITGFDHSGYCSEVEADEEDAVDLNRHIFVYCCTVVSDKDELEFKYDGCESEDGSGYCDGYYKKYTVISYERIKIDRHTLTSIKNAGFGRYENIIDLYIKKKK